MVARSDWFVLKNSDNCTFEDADDHIDQVCKDDGGDVMIVM